MVNYDVIIIGAGPGGIFSAYELSILSKDLNFTVFRKLGPEFSAEICRCVSRTTDRLPLFLIPMNGNKFFGRKHNGNS